MKPDYSPIAIPTIEQLQADVKKREKPILSEKSNERLIIVGKDEPKDLKLTPKAEAFLRHAVQPENAGALLEQRHKAIGVSDGSLKASILKELRSAGFIRMEKKGRGKIVHVYKAGYAYLEMDAPSGRGVGGTTHQLYVEEVAGLFKKRGYDVFVEHPIGPKKKRVDILALGSERIGIECGLTSAKQEVKNLRDDLESGAIDKVFLFSPNSKLLDKVRKGISEDSFLQALPQRIRLQQLMPGGEDDAP